MSVIPAAWRPPFFVLAAETFRLWRAEENNRESIVCDAATAIEINSRPWRDTWPRGLILRSSAENETLEDRGANESLRLAADFDTAQIGEALTSMFSSYGERGTSGAFSVVVQPLAIEGPLGHISNERRVSPTINQWRWERISPDADFGSFNSWRDKPDIASSLASSGRPRDLNRAFGAVGRWITDLNRGPAHLEWTFDGSNLWLLQLDFEFERPDDGIDPNDWLRKTKHRPSKLPPEDSALSAIDLDPTKSPSCWRKVENVRRFAAVCTEPYPPLVTLTGDRLQRAVTQDRSKLEVDLEAFAHGRVVCRTDCNTAGVKRENLPRTNTVSTISAIDHMVSFLQRLTSEGATAEETCFIAHQFIPARSGAWVHADPTSPIVRIDALWGVPDGLQYLPHDTFEIDVQRQAVSAERIRYKPRFIQETPDGSWQELKAKRTLGRTKSLYTAEAIELALISHAFAKVSAKPQMIMWFCGIPIELGIGANLPWFSMPPNPSLALVGETATPRWPRLVLKTLRDVEVAIATGVDRKILALDPEISLFRENAFIDRVIVLAKLNHCPVQLAGSTLAHAHYQLEKAGVSVVPTEPSGRARVRGRRIFSKLVRDEMPAQIASRGEIVVQSRLPRSEMRRALVAKLLEEAQELLGATDPDDVKGELADLLEVVRAMASLTGVSWSEVETAASDKRKSRGGFEDGAVLVGTEWPTPERTSQRMPPIVTLQSLGKVESGPERSSATYNALLASATGLEVEVGGQRVSVHLTREGVSLEVGRRGPAAPTQLELPLNADAHFGAGDESG